MFADVTNDIFIIVNLFYDWEFFILFRVHYKLSTLNIESEVPQYSILGPILYTIYVNFILLLLSIYFMIVIFYFVSCALQVIYFKYFLQSLKFHIIPFWVLYFI